MSKNEKLGLLLDVLVGSLLFGLLVTFASNSIEPKLKLFLDKRFPKIPYYIFLIISGFIIVSGLVWLKSIITRRIQIQNFELTSEDENDSRKYLTEAIKRGGFSGHTLKGMLDSYSPAELLPLGKLLRLKLGKRNSRKLASIFYKRGKNEHLENYDFIVARDCFLMAIALSPQNAVYPNEAGVISIYLKDYNKARGFFLTTMELYSKQRNWVEVAKMQNNLGNFFLRLKNYNEALVYFEKAKATYKKSRKSITANTITTEMNIASTYWQIRYFTKAIRLLEETEKSLPLMNISSNWNQGNEELRLKKVFSSEIRRKIAEIKLDMYNDHADKNLLVSAMQDAKTAYDFDLKTWNGGENEECFALSCYVLGKVYDYTDEKEQALRAYKQADTFLSKLKLEKHEPRDYCRRRINELEQNK